MMQGQPYPPCLLIRLVRRTVWIAILMSTLAVPALANPFLERLVPGESVEADPAADYLLSESDGPWFVMATSFSGDSAEQQAKDLVLELRQRYHMNAYTHAMTFDYTAEAPQPAVDRHGRPCVDRYGKPVKMRYQKNKKIEEIAVLVGDFPTSDDTELQKTLEKIKYLRPDVLRVAEDPQERKVHSQTLGLMRRVQKAFLPDGDERKKHGPMGHAFVTRNPLLSTEYFVPRGIDPLVAKMNKGVQYSLLDATGRYTIKVATFTGAAQLEQAAGAHRDDAIDGSKLAKAALDAHKLTLALRKLEFEAYEFHDRTESIVTIGSFDSVGTRMPDGSTRFRPEVEAIRRTFSAGDHPWIHPGADRSKIAAAQQQFEAAAQGPLAMATAHGIYPKHLVGIPFDVTPAVYEIPQRSISADYARN